MKFFIYLTKATLLAFYVLVPVSFMTSFLFDYRNILLIVLVAVVITHLVEYVAMKDKMLKAAPERSDHLIQTLLFGYGHWLPMLKSR